MIHKPLTRAGRYPVCPLFFVYIIAYEHGFGKAVIMHLPNYARFAIG